MAATLTPKRLIEVRMAGPGSISIVVPWPWRRMPLCPRPPLAKASPVPNVVTVIVLIGFTGTILRDWRVALNRKMADVFPGTGGAERYRSRRNEPL